MSTSVASFRFREIRKFRKKKKGEIRARFRRGTAPGVKVRKGSSKSGPTRGINGVNKVNIFWVCGAHTHTDVSQHGLRIYGEPSPE